MADTLLHVTLARAIGNHSTLSARQRMLLRDHMDDYLMGSVVFDLPYYENLLLSGIRSLRHEEPAYHPFGQRIHERECRNLCVSLLENARTPGHKALACGALTHFAVDIVFHREIERLVHRRNMSHDIIERQIGLVSHRQLLGHTGAGTAYAIQSTLLFPSQDWHRFVCSSFRKIHCDTPSRHQFKKWQRSFRAFGFLYCKSWFPWLSTAIWEDNEIETLSQEMRTEALKNAVRWINIAEKVFDGNHSAMDFANAMPPLKMSDGLEE